MKFRILALFALLALVMSVVPAFAQDETEEVEEETTEVVYPIVIEHQYGETVIEEEPVRIVALGYTEQDYWLALGIMPVAVRYWYGDEENALFPWAMELVEDEEDLPAVLIMPYDNLNYEAILALEPDLISAVTGGITEDEYLLLSEIAPTLTQSGDFPQYGMPWPEVTLMIGQSVGLEAEAQEIVDAVQELFDVVNEEYPEFIGKTAAVGYYFENFGLFTSQDNRGDFITRLGFVLPEEVEELAGESFYVDLSMERMDLLEQDVVVLVNVASIEGAIEELEADPIFGSLDVVTEGRVIYTEAALEDAISFNSPLSLSYAIELILPELEAIFVEVAE